ncbi:MAG: succinylglutamate desuccinylase/aspartoacylase family protein [Gammaproteobacteria bacterium]|nr:succinylglutamate desuccinylase/aspartoacylase family protein [Gammaproteobacteria bacterium]
MNLGILRLFRTQIFLLLSFQIFSVHALSLKHEVYHLKGAEAGKTILVVGGIQGDEPGGFTAASLLVTNYKIKKGNVLVIPNLNFNSIVESSRGLYGDMNRKFNKIKLNDPDFSAVEEVKRLIRDDKVDLILNLHDGSGFYREKHVDRNKNPNRWGQCIVIDQSYLDNSIFPDLEKIGTAVAESVNKKITNKEHQYRVRNTRTRAGNQEMQKTLTYYAVNQSKSAFGLEVSKSFPTHERVFFHLSLVEEFFQHADIKFERDFKLNSTSLAGIIGKNLDLTLYQRHIALDLDNVRRDIRYFPIKRDRELEFKSTNPLLAVFEKNGHYKVKYGNRNVSRLHPQFMEYDDSLTHVNFTADGSVVPVKIGDTVEVKKDFLVHKQDGYRVNVIGLVSNKKSEDELTVNRKSLIRRFSLDMKKQVYRVEFYKEKKFSGMILVKFVG